MKIKDIKAYPTSFPIAPANRVALVILTDANIGYQPASYRQAKSCGRTPLPPARTITLASSSTA